MTLTVSIRDGRPILVLQGITVDGRWRRWRRPLEVTLRFSGATATATASYELSIPALAINGATGISIIEAVQDLQRKIVTTTSPQVLETLLEA